MDNQKLVENLLHECVTNKNLSILDQLLTSNTMVTTNVNGNYMGPAKLKRAFRQWFGLFPDIKQQSTDWSTYDKGKVVMLTVYQWVKHEREFLAMAPTGKTIKLTTPFICVFNSKNKIIDYIVEYDLISVVDQIEPENMAEVVKRLNQPIFKAEDCVRYQYHSLIRYLNNLTLGQHTVRFSPRQLECLSLWLHCKTINEIGTILTISSNSANTYLSLAKENLGCHSKSQVYQQLDQLGTMHLFRKLYKLLMQEGRPDARINH